ncbi:MAG: DUF4445 domain-containing protein [Chloroflexi bacterium]|nr:DUF4445 domain-containing protein [Chloroflexota bacterium]
MLRFIRREGTGDLITPPYTARETHSVRMNTGELGLKIADQGQVYLLPSASAFVGADIVAGLVAVDIERWKRPVLMMDIGTNGEMVLVDEESLYACSTAAGPAFEGMNISCGLSAIDGAVESVLIDEDAKAMALGVIGDGRPAGLCGTGLIDTVAELVKVGAIDRTGRFSPDAGGCAYGGEEYLGTVRSNGKSSSFTIADRRTGEDLFSLSQRDVREVQLAKAAIRAGMDVLLQERGLRQQDLRSVLLAGGFGHRLRPGSLVRLGILSPELSRRLEVVGNTSLSGAYLALVSDEARRQAERLSGLVNTVNLSLHPGFERRFIDSMRFPDGKACYS